MSHVAGELQAAIPSTNTNHPTIPAARQKCTEPPTAVGRRRPSRKSRFRSKQELLAPPEHRRPSQLQQPQQEQQPPPQPQELQRIFEPSSGGDSLDDVPLEERLRKRRLTQQPSLKQQRQQHGSQESTRSWLQARQATLTKPAVHPQGVEGSDGQHFIGLPGPLSAAQAPEPAAEDYWVAALAAEFDRGPAMPPGLAGNTTMATAAAAKAGLACAEPMVAVQALEDGVNSDEMLVDPGASLDEASLGANKPLHCLLSNCIILHCQQSLLGLVGNAAIVKRRTTWTPLPRITSSRQA
jgi:hypothetical protein